MELEKEILLSEAIYLKNKGIKLPEILQEIYDQSSLKEKCEAEIKLIEAEYILEY